jgi:hypothetical protein
LAREQGRKWPIAQAQYNLGTAANAQGNDRQAAECFGESLRLAREMGNKGLIALSLVGWAGVAGAQEPPERVARLLGAVVALLDD